MYEFDGALTKSGKIYLIILLMIVMNILLFILWKIKLNRLTWHVTIFCLKKKWHVKIFVIEIENQFNKKSQVIS